MTMEQFKKVKRNIRIAQVVCSVLLFMTFIFALCMADASAYVDNGNGSVTLEYGDSFGNVAAAYDMNYCNLGYYNGIDPDNAVVQPGTTIWLGESSYSSMYGGDHPDYGYSDQAYGGYGYSEYTQDAPVYDYSQDYYSYDNSYSCSTETYSEPSYDSYYESQTVSEQTYAYNEVIGTASYPIGYAGNAAVNVTRACELNNGVTIPAGGTYRASDYIGSGSYDMGFVDAPGLMSDGSTPLMPGSGICPVTTYICKAGRDAGLTIVEANDHSGATCAYAAPGEQAMYNYGTSDLVMVNPFDHPITLTSSYINGVLTATWSE